MAADGKVIFKVDYDTTQATSSLDKLGSKLGSVAKKVTAFGLAGAAAFTAMAIKQAQELDGIEAKYNTVFDGMTDDMDAFIKEFQKLSPATKAEARKMASGIQDLLVPMGFAREEAGELTKDTLDLSAALASFNDVNPDEVVDAFQSALTGSTEPLKRFGIQVDQATIAQKAVEMGLAKTTKEVSKQAKAQALMALAQEQSKDAVKAFTKENLTSREKMKLAIRDVKDAAAKLGKLFIPAIESAAEWISEKFVPGLESLIEWLQVLPVWLEENETKLILLGVAIGTITALVIAYKIQVALATAGTTLWASVAAFATGVTTALGVAFAFLTSPIGLIIIAIGLLIAIVILVVKHFDTIKRIGSNVFSFLAAVIDSFVQGSIIAFKNFVGILTSIFDGIAGVVKGAINIAIDGINWLIKQANKIPGVNFKTLNRLGEEGPSATATSGYSQVPRLAVGTDEVLSDGLSVIHKGEAIVPASVVSGGFTGAMMGSSNQTTQINISQTPVYLELDGAIVGEAVLQSYSEQVLLRGGNT